MTIRPKINVVLNVKAVLKMEAKSMRANDKDFKAFVSLQFDDAK